MSQPAHPTYLEMVVEAVKAKKKGEKSRTVPCTANFIRRCILDHNPSIEKGKRHNHCVKNAILKAVEGNFILKVENKSAPTGATQPLPRYKINPDKLKEKKPVIKPKAKTVAKPKKAKAAATKAKKTTTKAAAKKKTTPKKPAAKPQKKKTPAKTSAKKLTKSKPKSAKKSPKKATKKSPKKTAKK